MNVVGGGSKADELYKAADAVACRLLALIGILYNAWWMVMLVGSLG